MDDIVVTLRGGIGMEGYMEARAVFDPSQKKHPFLGLVSRDPGCQCTRPHRWHVVPARDVRRWTILFAEYYETHTGLAHLVAPDTIGTTDPSLAAGIDAVARLKPRR